MKADRWPYVLAALASLFAARGWAQCPDGSLPPCTARRPAYVSRSTHRIPDTVRVLFDRAVEEGRRRTPESARESMRLLARVIAFDSNYAPAWATLARVAQLAWVRRWDIGGADADTLLSLAVRASRRAVQLDSGLVAAWVVYARAAGSVDVADRNASRLALDRALALEPRSTEALFELGLMEEELLRPMAAERAWRRVLAISPTHLETLTFLALHHLWQGNYVRARRLVDSALAVDPTYGVAREAAAEISLAQRRWDDADRHVLISTRGGGGQELAVAFTIRARAAAGRGRLDEARRLLSEGERLARLDRPTRHEAVFMGAAWAQLGDTAQALRWLGAYVPHNDLHFQLHLKREPGLQWLTSIRSPLLAPDPGTRPR